MLLQLHRHHKLAESSQFQKHYWNWRIYPQVCIHKQVENFFLGRSWSQCTGANVLTSTHFELNWIAHYKIQSSELLGNMYMYLQQCSSTHERGPRNWEVGNATMLQRLLWACDTFINSRLDKQSLARQARDETNTLGGLRRMQILHQSNFTWYEGEINFATFCLLLQIHNYVCVQNQILTNNKSAGN